MSLSLAVVIVSWMFAYVQTHHNVHIKYVQFFIYQLYLNKAVKNANKRSNSATTNSSSKSKEKTI